MSEIKILEISKLLECNFFIPSYQRGYRWTEKQVTDLLDDVWEFINNPQKSDWYCLQPVVVKETNFETKNEFNLSGIWYDVIDGQQRLTTIFLILKFVESEKNNFKIQYESRNDSEHFLSNIASKTKEDSKKNVDYFHLFNAYSTINTWFKNKANEGHSSISLNFITPFKENVKVIWYETSNNEDSIDIFTRINSGKIPLTNAELIKALFLRKANFGNPDLEKEAEKIRLKQLEIASEWDRIEYALQDDSFWYFINKNENNLATRIEYIFNLMADKKEKDDDFYTFRFFNEKFKIKSEKETIDNNWQEIKKYFQTLEEWYIDRELYHKIGFLIAIGTVIKTIVKEKEDRSKSQFSSCINKQIYNKIKDVDIDNLEYGNTNIRNILLLHNVLTMLKNENETSRFPFDRFKKENWDVEHIHAIATNIKVKKENQVEWLINNFVKTENHQNEELNNNIESIKSGDSIEEKDFEKIIEYVIGEDDNNIQNLCLLDRGTNRSYKNDAFKEKRKKIIERELEGTFIPICTKNAFMKANTKEVKDLEIWNNNDKSAYKGDIKRTFNNFFKSINNSINEQ